MLCLLGKTSTGKTTLLEYLVRYGLRPVVSYTTRPPRKGEVDGKTYHFVAKEKFFELNDSGFFAETTSYNVATGETWYYGSAVEDLKNDESVIILNPEGFKQIKNIDSINAISFLVTASEDTIRRRLVSRGDNPEEAERRLAADKKDFEGIYDLVDFSFSNDIGIDVSSLSFLIYHTYTIAMDARKG